MKRLYKTIIFFVGIFYLLNSTVVNALDKKDDYIKEYKDPIKNRSSKEFMEYYKQIWDDLNYEK